MLIKWDLASVVHQYCFGNNWNLLGDVNLSAVRRNNVAAVLSTVKIMLHFSWIRDIMDMLPSSIGERIMPPGIRDLVEFQKKIRVEIDNILTRKPSQNEMPSIFTLLRDNPELAAAEKSAKRLEDEASLITMAGTYSPMLSLMAAHYHLLAHPEVIAKLRKELAANPAAGTASQLGQLPYLSAVAQEAHRLTFGLTGRNARLCPDEALVYTAAGRTHVLPPGTSLSASTLLVHTDEALFPRPWHFDPDRWLAADPALLARRRRAMLAFGRGPRICVGMHLAHAEMAALIAAMARWDMELFETGPEDVAFCHDYNVMCPKLGSKGLRVKVLGRYRDANTS